MNNYLMFDKILKCSVVPQERVSKKIFKNKINPNRPPKKSQRVKAKKMHNSAKEEETLVKNRNKQMKKMGRINKKLEDAGIDYKFQFAESPIETFQPYHRPDTSKSAILSNFLFWCPKSFCTPILNMI